MVTRATSGWPPVEARRTVRLRQDGVALDAIAFDHARLVPELGAELAFVFAPSLDAWRGETRVRLVIERMWLP